MIHLIISFVSFIIIYRLYTTKKRAIICRCMSRLSSFQNIGHCSMFTSIMYYCTQLPTGRSVVEKIFLELQTRILMFGIMPTSILLKYMPCLLSYSCQNCQYILEVFSCTSMVRIKSVPDSQSSLCTPNHQPCDVIFNLHQPQLDDLEGPF